MQFSADPQRKVFTAGDNRKKKKIPINNNNTGNQYVEIEKCPSETDQVGRAPQCAGCPGRQMCETASSDLNTTDDASSSTTTQSPAQIEKNQIRVRMKAIKKKVLILAGKGGVGKSSMTSVLAMGLANPEVMLKGGRIRRRRRGEGELKREEEGSGFKLKVGVVDLDITGPSQAKLLGVEGKDVINSDYGWNPIVSPHCGIKVISIDHLMNNNNNNSNNGSAAAPVIWRGPRKTGLIKQFVKDVFWSRLDCLLFDTPPGTSDEHLTVVKALSLLNNNGADGNGGLTGAIIVTTPQPAALVTVRKEINFCIKLRIPIVGVIENMSGFACPCCDEVTHVFSSDGGERLAEEFDIPFLGKLPLSSCCEKGTSVFDLGIKKQNIAAANQQPKKNQTGTKEEVYNDPEVNVDSFHDQLALLCLTVWERISDM
eukprot:Nk52_evm3s402 gene=Nk52_evmTU3s402